MISFIQILYTAGLFNLNLCNKLVRFLQAQASKTREVVAQQRVVIQLEEQLKATAAPIAAAKAKRDKVQGFLKVRAGFRWQALFLRTAIVVHKRRDTCEKVKKLLHSEDHAFGIFRSCSGARSR